MFRRRRPVPVENKCAKCVHSRNGACERAETDPAGFPCPAFEHRDAFDASMAGRAGTDPCARRLLFDDAGMLTTVQELLDGFEKAGGYRFFYIDVHERALRPLNIYYVLYASFPTFAGHDTRGELFFDLSNTGDPLRDARGNGTGLSSRVEAPDLDLDLETGTFEAGDLTALQEAFKKTRLVWFDRADRGAVPRA